MDGKEKKEKKKKSKDDPSDRSEASSAKDKKPEPATVTSTDAKPWDPLAQLTKEDERKAFAKMKENLANVTDPEQKAFLTDAEIIRYLKARDFEVSKSESLIRETLEWRFNTYKPHLIDPTVIQEEIKTGKNYVSTGRDRHGRPILYMKPRFENTKNYKEQLWLLVYHMEKSIRSMDESKGVTQWVWIMDFRGFSVSNSPPFSTQRETINLLSNHYPERLGLAIILHPPFYFTVFFSAIRPFIPPATSQKIVFCKTTDPKKIMTELSPHISPENLETDYGGELNYTFKFEEYWPPEVQRYKDYIAARNAQGGAAPAAAKP